MKTKETQPDTVYSKVSHNSLKLDFEEQCDGINDSGSITPRTVGNRYLCTVSTNDLSQEIEHEINKLKTSELNLESMVSILKSDIDTYIQRQKDIQSDLKTAKATSNNTASLDGNTFKALEEKIKAVDKEEKSYAGYSQNIVRYKDEIIARLDAIKSHLKQLESLHDIIDSDVKLYKQLYIANNVEVRRYGLDIDSISQNIKDFLIKSCHTTTIPPSISSKAQPFKAKLINFFELMSLKQAMHDLHKGGQKAVLVDVFDRDADGVIKRESNELVIHTIVLCNANENRFTLIDPNNSNNTKHLEFNSAVLDVGKILCPQKELKIYVVPSQEELAKNKQKVGTDTRDYRDCIDVSVKLAFGLQIMKESEVDYRMLYDMPLIKAISNNSDIDAMMGMIDNNPVRVKQASNPQIIQNLFKLCQWMKNNDNTLSKYSVKAVFCVHDILSEAYPTSDEYHTLIQNLQKYAQQLHQQVQVQCGADLDFLNTTAEEERHIMGEDNGE